MERLNRLFAFTLLLDKFYGRMYGNLFWNFYTEGTEETVYMCIFTAVKVQLNPDKAPPSLSA
jgi:hypothetical protein